MTYNEVYSKDIMPFIDVGCRVLYDYGNSDYPRITEYIVTGIEKCKYMKTTSEEYNCYYCKGRIKLNDENYICTCYGGFYCRIVKVMSFIEDNEFKV